MSNYESRKLYAGSVSVWKNSNNKLVLEADAAGEWSNRNVSDLYLRLKSLAKEHKATINLFKPESDGTVMCILTGRGGHPYLAMLPESKAGSANKRVKLA